MTTAPDPAAPDIRAAFFDIDGTLTSFTTHAVPQSTVDALHALRAHGMKTFICTGRAPSQTPIVLDALPVEFDGIVGVNGQYCWDANGVIGAEPMDPGDVRTILDWLDAHPSVVACFSEADATYFNHDSAQLRAMWGSLGKTAPHIDFIDPRTRTNPIYQISPYIDTATEAELVSLCHAVRGVRWHPDFVDLIPADGGKNRGMERMLHHYGLTRSQSIAFGDGGNDIDMLRYAGIGVAMGNATDETKQAADYVTGSVDDGGIAQALRHFGVL